MINEISIALTSLKAASDIIKGFNSLQLDVAVKEKSSELFNIIISLQSNILSMQSEYSDVLRIKGEIENELLQLKEWNSSKDKYMLKEIAPHVLTYVYKNQEYSASDKHWLCANCFDNFHKESIYQIKKSGNYPDHIYYCPLCKNEILIKNAGYKPISPKIGKIGSGGNWSTKY
jgi:hypothetical protein